MNFFETARTIVALLPTIIKAINTVEDLFPEGGNGAAKLELVKTMLESANDHSDRIDNFEEFWGVINKTITGLVKMLKLIRK